MDTYVYIYSRRYIAAVWTQTITNSVTSQWIAMTSKNGYYEYFWGDGDKHPSSLSAEARKQRALMNCTCTLPPPSKATHG